MILTLTVNPSIDRLARLDTELKRGGVFRLPMAEDMAGGKGINVSKALHYAGEKTLALYPASDSVTHNDCVFHRCRPGGSGFADAARGPAYSFLPSVSLRGIDCPA